MKTARFLREAKDCLSRSIQRGLQKESPEPVSKCPRENLAVPELHPPKRQIALSRRPRALAIAPRDVARSVPSLARTPS